MAEPKITQINFANQPMYWNGATWCAYPPGTKITIKTPQESEMADTHPIKRTRRINDIGIGMAGIGDELVKDFRVYSESGSVQVWIELFDRSWNGTIHEAMQYLTPEEAMRFAKAFERCAIQALKEMSE